MGSNSQLKPETKSKLKSVDTSSKQSLKHATSSPLNRSKKSSHSNDDSPPVKKFKQELAQRHFNASDDSDSEKELQIDNSLHLKMDMSSADSDISNDSILLENLKKNTSTPKQAVSFSRDKSNKKHKEKIYSSSENEDVKTNEVPIAEVPKPEADDIYFDGWTKADVAELIRKIDAVVSNKDTLKYSSRVEKLPWDQIKFGTYTAADCKEKWKSIEKKIRGYRILKEILEDAKVWIDQPWIDFYRGGKKKNRHPEMPKKPLTSYMLFYMAKKAKIAEEHPGLGMTQLSKVIAEKFNSLPEKKKAKYHKKALSMRQEYQEKLQKFYLDHPAEELKLAKTKKAKAQAGPLKPVPPIKLYVDSKLKAHENEKDANIPKLRLEYKEKWKTLSRKKKIPFIRWAYEAEAKYLDDLKAYAAVNPNAELRQFKSVLSKEEKSIYQRMEGKPEKPPSSAYSLFSKLKLKDENLKMKYPTPKERLQEIARLWKNVPKIEKDAYAAKLKCLLENYKLEYASYLESLPEDRREEELASNLPKKKAKPETEAKNKINTLFAKSKQKPQKNLKEAVLAKEPAQPPQDSYQVFHADMIKMGYPEKNIVKTWNSMKDSEKDQYRVKLEQLKQKYILDYKQFLSNLTTEELMIYSETKKNRQDNDALSEEEEDSSDDEEEVKKDKAPSSSSTSDSSSSSDSSDSSSSEEDNLSDAF
ncbi:nucleolar transcription factor 1-A-like isoform X2 [Cimex lectularius]|uniref:HMG box domain-containing protein n=1 Tax=Cimex lectularius TaxID=79782 RepID=A0A8I6RJN9_CIMLE|nr:nucleolar transcription factor 1-A-like isoform X2 [Cimex lectularius]